MLNNFTVPNIFDNNKPLNTNTLKSENMVSFQSNVKKEKE
jgi:hypothetical protein